MNSKHQRNCVGSFFDLLADHKLMTEFCRSRPYNEISAWWAGRKGVGVSKFKSTFKFRPDMHRWQPTVCLGKTDAAATGPVHNLSKASDSTFECEGMNRILDFLREKSDVRPRLFKTRKLRSYPPVPQVFHILEGRTCTTACGTPEFTKSNWIREICFNFKLYWNLYGGISTSMLFASEPTHAPHQRSSQDWIRASQDSSLTIEVRPGAAFRTFRRRPVGIIKSHSTSARREFSRKR